MHEVRVVNWKLAVFAQGKSLRNTDLGMNVIPKPDADSYEMADKGKCSNALA
jgi:hypothetical protein